MAAVRPPVGLGAGGKALWKAILEDHPNLDAGQRVQLEEACRSKDRLDKLDQLLRGDLECWAEIVQPGESSVQIVKIDGALTHANTTANLMKQLLAALRLPDEVSGKRVPARAARGVYKPSGGSGKVSSLERARAAKGA